MKCLNVKYWVTLNLLLHSFLMSAQGINELTFVNSGFGGDQTFRMVLNQLTRHERTMQESLQVWCREYCERARYVGITHQPSADFNIYLAFHNSVTPRIRTSFEVSLNYAGVMNVKSIIALRKKDR